MKYGAFTIRVQKTIQERQYEPYVVSIELKVDPDVGEVTSLDEAIHRAHEKLSYEINECIASRLASRGTI